MQSKTCRAAAAAVRVALLLAGGSVSLCSAAAFSAERSTDPYAIAKEEFQARIHTIALSRLQLPIGTQEPERIQRDVERLLTDWLRDIGYRTVSTTEFETAWRAKSMELGGTYDAVTGAPTKGAHSAARQAVARALAIDAVLEPAITIAAADVSCMGACRVMQEPLTFNGGPVHDADNPQKALGAYLMLVIADNNGQVLYARRTPIEWTSVYVARSYEEKPAAQRFDEPDRIERAVDDGLEPLVWAAKRE